VPTVNPDSLVLGDFYQLIAAPHSRRQAPPGLYRYTRWCPSKPPKRIGAGGGRPMRRRAWMASMNPSDAGQEYCVIIRDQVWRSLGSTPEEAASNYDFRF
jgi:hypothetical protein